MKNNIAPAPFCTALQYMPENFPAVGKTKNGMNNAIKKIAIYARPAYARVRFDTAHRACNLKKRYPVLKRCDTFLSSLNCRAGAENTVIDSGVYTATLSAVSLRPNFMVLDVRVLPIRKDGSMAESMFSPPSRPSRVPEKRMEWFFQSHSGEEAMTNVIPLASARAANPVHTSAQIPTFKPAPVSPARVLKAHTVERQQAIENALSMALHYIRHSETPSNIHAATVKALRAATMLKQACAELTAGSAA